MFRLNLEADTTILYFIVIDMHFYSLIKAIATIDKEDDEGNTSDDD